MELITSNSMPMLLFMVKKQHHLANARNSELSYRITILTTKILHRKNLVNDSLSMLVQSLKIARLL